MNISVVIAAALIPIASAGYFKLIDLIRSSIDKRMREGRLKRLLLWRAIERINTAPANRRRYPITKLLYIIGNWLGKIRAANKQIS